MARVLRPFTGGQYGLEIEDESGNNIPVGFVVGIDGGHFKADEVKWMVGYENYKAGKFPGKSKVEDITITLGMANSEAFWDWIKESLDNKPTRRSGAIIAYDFKRKERQRRNFHDAIISEIGFPALDSASKQSAYLTVKLSPETIDFDESNKGTKITTNSAQNEMQKQKMWLSSNFAFELDMFQGDPSLKSAKIEAFTVKQNVVSNPVGNRLDTPKYPSRLEMPSIQVSFSASNVKPWYDWFNDSVINGKIQNQQTTGSITYYASDGENTELMRLDLDGVGLTALEFDKHEAAKEGIMRVKASLFVKSITLATGDGNV
jgi:phage tail-like protein